MPFLGDIMVGLGAKDRDLHRDLKRGEAGMKHYAKTAKKQATAAQQAMKKIGGALGTMFGGYAMLQMGKNALMTASNFQKAMNRVRALSGATGSDFAALRKQALDLGRTTAWSASQAAEAMGFLSMAGFNVNQTMKAMPGTLALASAGQIELGRAADIASNILTGFGMEASRMNEVADKLTVTFTRSNVDLEMLGESFKYAAPVAKAAGLSFNETAAYMGLLGNAGIQGSMAGTSLRQTLAKLLKPTKAAREVLDRLGISTLDSSGKVRSLDTIMGELIDRGAGITDILTIFGIRAGPGMAAALEQGLPKLREMIGELENADGAAQNVADIQLEGLDGQIKLLKSAWEDYNITMADATGGLTMAEAAVATLRKALVWLGEGKWGTQLGEDFSEGFKSIANDMIGFATFLPDKMLSVAAFLPDKIVGIFTDTDDAVSKVLHGALAKWKDIVKKGVGKIVDAFAWMYDKIVGHSIIPELLDRIAREYGRLQEVMVTPTERAVSDTIKSFDELSRGGLGTLPSRIALPDKPIDPDQKKRSPYEAALADYEKRLDLMRQEEQLSRILTDSRINALGTLEQSLAREQELYRDQISDFEQSGKALLSAKAITEEEYQAWHAEITQAHNARMIEIQAEHDQAMLSQQTVGFNALEMLAVKHHSLMAGSALNSSRSLLQGLGQHNRQAFEANKIFAIGDATVSAYQGIAKTLKTYPYPLNVGMAAAHGVLAFHQVQKIRSQSFGGGGGGVSVGGGASVSAMSTPTLSSGPNITPSEGAQAGGRQVSLIVDISRLKNQRVIIDDMTEFVKELYGEFNKVAGMGVHVEFE